MVLLYRVFLWRDTRGRVMRPVDEHIETQLTERLDLIGKALCADVVAVVSPIVHGLEGRLRAALDALPHKRASIAVILDTVGGIVEVVERMAVALRHAYGNVTMIVPDRAMSAGTIFALSADRIMMDYLSCLGPVDPQILRGKEFVPALSYLNQFERLNDKANKGSLTTAELALLGKLDLGDLYQFEQARELSVELLINWLSKYKFKDWTRTETRGVVVTDEMKEERARHIADLLSDTERWHSHGRAIDRRTLREEVNLKIEDLESDEQLYGYVRTYFKLLEDYMHRESLVSFVHSREYF